jgi:hypothetical protein
VVLEAAELFAEAVELLLTDFTVVVQADKQAINIKQTQVFKFIL